MKPFRQIALLTAAMLLLSAAGCGKKEDSQMQDSSSQSTWSMADPSLNLPTLNLGHTTEDMIRRAVVNPGNTARLADAMKRAQAGEKITIGTIGGSITQGTAASTTDERYANRALQWWAKAFPKAQLDFVNAGIGATDSYIGVHRVDADLLSKKPDVVIVEFSVNDTDAALNLQTYDSLVRKILQAENHPAVILLFTTQEDGTSLQDTHMQIGSAYNLPMISYKNAVLPEIEAGKFTWKDISPDNIHPNSVGHGIIGELLWSYFNSVYAKLDQIDTSDLTFTATPVTKDLYAKGQLLDSKTLTPKTMQGFEQAEVSNQFPNDWTTKEGGELTFEVTGSNIGVLYYKTVDGKSGQYCVYVDDRLIQVLDGDFTGGWGNYAQAQQVYTSDTPSTHTVTIKQLEGTDLTQFTVLGLLVS
ncbi:SGNH/GDSL hydrolase family protein [Ruminococcus champanellensis]|uniref:SGNH/GDSL hydrolase family protein n=1 Tax=Ruminococcus champanellensis TaxID=1161942 RepID=UPI002E781631|nr:SGNH/GDSL hydrolase family protein [Ruminococcus champanellensis]MED9890823.1 SGNH/GDSL hydrolase family protein [Ruminococcus champanellensis]